MATIIPFPERSTLKTKLEDSMGEMRASLTEMYEALDKVEKGFIQIQNQAHEMEDSYQQLMKLYIEEVGEDNVPLEWLDFCPYVGMTRDATTGEIKITLVNPKDLEKDK